MRQKTRLILLKTFVGALLTVLVSLSLYVVSAKASHELHDGDVTFVQWTDTTSLPEYGKYYLDVDVTLKNDLSVNNMLSICLNGHKICPDGNVRIFVAQHSSLLEAIHERHVEIRRESLCNLTRNSVSVGIEH